MLDIKILKQSLKECYNNAMKRKYLLSQLQEKQKDFKILKEFLFERFY